MIQVDQTKPLSYLPITEKVWQGPENFSDWKKVAYRIAICFTLILPFIIAVDGTIGIAYRYFKEKKVAEEKAPSFFETFWKPIHSYRILLPLALSPVLLISYLTYIKGKKSEPIPPPTSSFFTMKTTLGMIVTICILCLSFKICYTKFSKPPKRSKDTLPTEKPRDIIYKQEDQKKFSNNKKVQKFFEKSPPLTRI